jgi:hypothetical protein
MQVGQIVRTWNTKNTEFDQIEINKLTKDQVLIVQLVSRNNTVGTALDGCW